MAEKRDSGGLRRLFPLPKCWRAQFTAAHSPFTKPPHGPACVHGNGLHYLPFARGVMVGCSEEVANGQSKPRGLDWAEELSQRTPAASSSTSESRPHRASHVLHQRLILGHWQQMLLPKGQNRWSSPHLEVRGARENWMTALGWENPCSGPSPVAKVPVEKKNGRE